LSHNHHHHHQGASSHKQILNVLDVTFPYLADISDVSEDSIAALHMSDFEGFSALRLVYAKQHGVILQTKLTAFTTSNETL